MRLLATAGSPPGSIVENAAPWEWMGVLQLLSDPGQVRFVEVGGFGGNFFHANLNPVTGLIFITPMARLDYEWFTRAGQTPVVDFHLDFFMSDGTKARSAATFTVNVLDIDDTPPQALRFSSGGSVRADVKGATIGRLQVDDPDTPAGGHSFHLSEEYSWQFMIVGNELRLRPGVQLDLTDGPHFPIFLNVSDGRQSAGFRLDIAVLPNPGASTTPIDVMAPGEVRKGFYHTSVDHVGTYAAPWSIASVSRAADLMRVDTVNGDTVWFKATKYIDFTSGFVDFTETGVAARLWLAFQTVFDRGPSLWEMRYFHDRVSAWGATERNVLDWALNYSPKSSLFASMTNRQFVEHIYANAVDYAVSSSTITWHAGRLDSGATNRIDFVGTIMNWRSAFSDFKGAAYQGFYVPRANMEEITGLISTAAGWAPNPHVWHWWSAWRAGTFDLFGLSWQIAQHPDFAARWGHMGNQEFAQQFYQQITGRPLGEQELKTITWWLDSGTGKRHEFMAHAALQMTENSFFRTLPQGAMFDVVW